MYRMDPGGRLSIGPDGQSGELAADFRIDGGGVVSVRGSFDCVHLAA
jgi:hypothetical protein